MLLILYRGMAALGVTLFGGMAEYTEYSNVLRVSMRFESVYMYILFLFWVLKYSVYSVFCFSIFCKFRLFRQSAIPPHRVNHSLIEDV